MYWFLLKLKKYQGYQGLVVQEGIVQGKMFEVKNPGGNCQGGSFMGVSSPGVIVQEGNYSGVILLGENFIRGSCPGVVVQGEISRENNRTP